MSVLLLPPSHFRLLIQAAHEYRVKVEPDTLQMLWRTNVASYAYRYRMGFERASEEAPTPGFACHVVSKVDPVQAIKAVKCYICQISDLPDYRTLPAYRWAEDLLYSAIAELPGWNTANAWPFEERCSKVAA